jgi:hypothetical protein
MKYSLRVRGYGWVERARLGSLLLLVCAAAGGCGSDEKKNDLPTPEGFAGNGGLDGASGFGMPGQTAGKGAGKAGSGGKSGGPNSQPGAAGLPGGTCANAVADTEPVTPTVWLVVDGSSSMSNNFDAGQNRWQALRATLMDQGAVVDSLQSVVRFGLVVYAGNAATPDNCVQLITVEPALNNRDAIAAMYPMNPVASGTPSDKALDYVVTNLPVTNMSAPDDKSGPVYVVFATDGSPNKGCGDLNGNDPAVEQNVIDVTKRGTDAGMNMFVISMAGGDNRLQSHLDKVAAATATKTPPFVPSTRGELISTFQKIVSGASCQIDLKGQVDTGAACSGKVTLDGKDLECNNDNGWKLVDENTFQLNGSACTTFLSKASMVYAMFPCEVFRPD